MGMRQEAHGPRWGSQPAWASEALQTPQQASDTDRRTGGLILVFAVSYL